MLVNRVSTYLRGGGASGGYKYPQVISRDPRASHIVFCSFSCILQAFLLYNAWKTKAMKECLEDRVSFLKLPCDLLCFDAHDQPRPRPRATYVNVIKAVDNKSSMSSQRSIRNRPKVPLDLRKRTPQACIQCRSAKRRCSSYGGDTCAGCLRRGQKCEFGKPEATTAPKAPPLEIYR